MLTEDETEALLPLLEVRMTARLRPQMEQRGAGFLTELDKRVGAALARNLSRLRRESWSEGGAKV